MVFGRNKDGPKGLGGKAGDEIGDDIRSGMLRIWAELRADVKEYVKTLDVKFSLDLDKPYGLRIGLESKPEKPEPER